MAESVERGRHHVRNDIAESLREMGHTPGEWEAAGIAGWPRSTCATCGAAAISGPRFAYGSALDRPCRSATEEGRS